MSALSDRSNDAENPYDQIPEELQERDQWLLWDASADTPRRPHWDGNFGVSWSDPDDWHSFEEAVEAAQTRESWGIGYVMALDNSDYPRGLYGCLDLDGCVEDTDRRGPKDWLPSIESLIEGDAYVEYSASGTGLHIPIVGHEPPEWWSDSHFSADEHEGVEYLTNKFVAFTGDTLDGAGGTVTDADPTQFLFNCYEEIRGEAPALSSQGESRDYDGDEWLDDDLVEEALSSINPDCSHEEWIRLGYAVHDYDAGSFGKSLFESWSKRGSKWDDAAQSSIEAIWSDADKGSDVTVATLVHEAKDAGWEPPSRDTNPTLQTDKTGSNDTGRDITLCPSEVTALAGLGEDETVADLTDRQKAACVWELLKQCDDYHVRVRRDNGSLWAYNSGIWERDGERTLRHAARQALGPMNYGSNVLSELKEQARSDPVAEVDPNDMGLSAGYVAVENGLLNLEAAANEGEALRDLEPENYALTRLPVEYDPDAGYDEWSSYVEEWAEDGRADALQEYVGYCLHIGEMPIHRALLLVGSGANGKGTFLSVVRTLLGEENTTSTELQTLANEKDAVADFYGALANIDDDLSPRELGNGMGMFKKLVGGDHVRARHLYEDGFQFKATGKHLYAANEVPDVSDDVPDDDEAFWRRWLLVEFPNHYPPSERDPSLEGQFTSGEALSGVLNWAIDGWNRLLDQGHFTNESRHAHTKRERWQAWGDSVDKFISDCVERDTNAENKSTNEVYNRFIGWCRENGFDSVGQQKLTNALKNEDVGYGPSVRTDDGIRRGYKSLSLSEEVPDRRDPQEEEDDDDGQQQGLV